MDEDVQGAKAFFYLLEHLLDALTQRNIATHLLAPCSERLKFLRRGRQKGSRTVCITEIHQ